MALAEQKQSVQRRRDGLQVTEDRRVLHADAAHALGPHRVRERRADHAEHETDDEVAARQVLVWPCVSCQSASGSTISASSIVSASTIVTLATRLVRSFTTSWKPA